MYLRTINSFIKYLFLCAFQIIRLSNPDKLSSAVDQNELERIAAHAQNFLKEIMYTLQNVKPELLLLFKTKFVFSYF